MKENNWVQYTLFLGLFLAAVYLLSFPAEKKEKKMSLDEVIRQQLVFQQNKKIQRATRHHLR